MSPHNEIDVTFANNVTGNDRKPIECVRDVVATNADQLEASNFKDWHNTICCCEVFFGGLLTSTLQGGGGRLTSTKLSSSDKKSESV